MTAPLRERLARELYRWSYGYDDEQLEYYWNKPWTQQGYYRIEADRILKMVCGSCGLAIPLMGKGKKNG
jgi:hypothetical protein